MVLTNYLSTRAKLGFSLLEALVCAGVLALILLAGSKAYQVSLASSAELPLTADALQIASTSIMLMRAHINQAKIYEQDRTKFTQQVESFLQVLQTQINSPPPDSPFEQWQLSNPKTVAMTASAYDAQREGVPIVVKVTWLGVRDNSESKQSVVINTMIARRPGS